MPDISVIGTSESQVPTARIARQLALALVVLNVLTITLAALTLHSSYLVQEDRARAATNNLSLVLDRDLDGLFDNIDLALKNLVDNHADLHTLGHFDGRTWSMQLHRQRAHLPLLDGLRGVDAEGNILYGLNPDNPTGINIADRDYFIAHRDASDLGLNFSRPIMARVSKKWSLLLSRRLNAPNGVFAGIVAASIPLERLIERYAVLKLGKDGSVAIRDEDLKLIVRHPELPDRQNSSNRISEEFAKALRIDARFGNYISGTTSMDGIHRLHSYRHLEKYPFYINVGTAPEEYLAVWYDELRWTLGLTGLFVLMSMLFAWLQHRAWRRQQSYAQRLIKSEKDFRSLSQAAPYGIVRVASDTAIVYVNPEVTRVLGYSHDDLPNIESWWLRAYPDPQYRQRVKEEWQRTVIEPASAQPMQRVFSVATRDGGKRDIKFVAETLEDQSILVTLEDITERLAAENEIRNLAFFDSLTGLPNRRLLVDRLHHVMLTGARNSTYSAALLFDLDRFKNLNDSQGHDAGDKLLIEVAHRLQLGMRECDTVSRLGGDEFVALLSHLSSEMEDAAMQAKVIGEKLIEQLQQPYLFGNASYQGTASIGVTLFKGTETTVDEVLKRADLAMYQAKASGRNALRFFDPAMQATVNAHAAMENELRQAVSHSEFLLYYQPQVSAAGACVGVEALIRWQSPTRGFVSPLDFIPLAEDTGLILPIGDWVLYEACERLKNWQNEPLMAHLVIAVNVSARQFAQSDFVERVRRLIELHGIDGEKLKLEITESMLVGNIEDIVKIMVKLRAIGVRFALDDFGTGYSSLSYLKRLPLDQLKIDQSFVRDITVDQNDSAICRAIIALGNSLGLDIVAEGVETQQQLDFLNAENCGYAQGYFFAKPMTEADLRQWLSRASMSLKNLPEQNS